MNDKFNELQERLAMVSFLTELVDLEDPFKKSAKTDEAIRLKAIEKFKEFASGLICDLLDESPRKTETINALNEDELLLIKAWAKNMMSKESVKKIMAPGSPVSPTPPRGMIKIANSTPPTGANFMGRIGKIVDIEDAQGVVGGLVDCGTRFQVVGKHSVEGYYEACAIDDKGRPTGVRFLVHADSPEWVEGK